MRRHLTDTDSDLEGDENGRRESPAPETPATPEPNVINLTGSRVEYDMDLDRVVITIDATKSDHTTETDRTADKDGDTTAENTTKGDHVMQTDGTADKDGDAIAEDTTESDRTTQTKGTAYKDRDATAKDTTEGDHVTQSDGTVDIDGDVTTEDMTKSDQVMRTADKDGDLKTKDVTGIAYCSTLSRPHLRAGRKLMAVKRLFSPKDLRKRESIICFPQYSVTALKKLKQKREKFKGK